MVGVSWILVRVARINFEKTKKRATATEPVSDRGNHEPAMQHQAQSCCVRHPRAGMAVAHSILIIGYAMLKDRPELLRAWRQLPGADQQGPTPTLFP